MASLTERVKRIEARNQRVEADKAWEVSLTRRALIAALTYCVVGLSLSAMDIERPWLNALVPSAAFFVSTLTLSLAKKAWLSKR